MRYQVLFTTDNNENYYIYAVEEFTADYIKAKTLFINSTYSGKPSACLAGNKVISYIETTKDINEGLTGVELLELLETAPAYRELVYKAARTKSQECLDNLKLQYNERQMLKQKGAMEKTGEVCAKCNGTGTYENELGLTVYCACNERGFVSANTPYRTKKEQIRKEREEHKESQDLKAIVESLTGSTSLDTKYDTETMYAELDEQAKSSSVKGATMDGAYTIKNFKLYDDLLHDVLKHITEGTTKELNSYLIGAPNGFGQEYFVDECLIKLATQGRKAVPMISLTELTEVNLKHNGTVVDTINREEINSEYVSTKFNWRDYVYADIVFLKLCGLNNKAIESNTLYSILQERGLRKLPTIVFTNFAMNIYLTDIKLKRAIWDDILHYTHTRNGKVTNNKTKLNHIATYKEYK